MSSLNKAIIIGRLGADPELRYTADGTPVASFNVATSEVRKDKTGNRQEKTEWHRIVLWRKLAEIAGEYLKKGRLVYVEGKIQSREYEGRDGIKRKVYEIVGDTMKLIGGGPSDTGDRGRFEAAPHAADPDFIDEPEDDVPM
jgi:single-strand DNA-binding protein